MADIVCPLCGTTYEGLNLDETNGWFICTKYDIDLCSGIRQESKDSVSQFLKK